MATVLLTENGAQARVPPRRRRKPPGFGPTVEATTRRPVALEIPRHRTAVSHPPRVADRTSANSVARKVEAKHATLRHRETSQVDGDVLVRNLEWASHTLTRSVVAVPEPLRPRRASDDAGLRLRLEQVRVSKASQAPS
jgi:hypothetical protein